MDADFWEEHQPKFLKSAHLAEGVPHYTPVDPSENDRRRKTISRTRTTTQSPVRDTKDPLTSSVGTPQRHYHQM